MENEKKRNKILEIILIILVSLSLVLIPLLNQYRQKTISLNNTQLVHRENARNGTIDISDYNFGKVYTITSSFKDFTINTIPTFDYQDLIDGTSLTGSSDVFGYGFTNYFRFSPIVFNNTTYFCLQYYVNLTSTDVLIYNLAYYSAFEDSDDTGTFIYFNPLTRVVLENFGVSPTFNVLNFMTYVGPSLDLFLDFYLDNNFGKLFSVQNDYKYPSNIDSYIFARNTKFVNFEQDFITSLLNSTSSSSYQEGYNVGYNVGYNESTTNNSVFTMLKYAANSIQDLLNIEVLPNISLWLLISIPLSVSIMLILFKLLRGDN